MGKSDGTCFYPTVNCGMQTCSADKLVPVGTCNMGSCSTPSPQLCPKGFVCAANACKTTCATNSDCEPDFYCWNGACHSDVVSVAGGFNHTCAALKDGRVFCWGDNTDGELGNGTVGGLSPIPVQVMGVSNATQVGLGTYFSCALTSAGGVVCWGVGTAGQLGTGKPNPATGDYIEASATGVVTASGTALSGAKALAVGNSAACAIVNGGIDCWGDNGGHSLNVDAVTTATAQPVRQAMPVLNISTAPNVLAMGTDFQVASFTSNQVCPWGTNNTYDTIAMSCPGNCFVPQGQCFSASSVNQVTAGSDFACARMGGSVECWGDDVSNQLNTTDTSLVLLPPPGALVNLSPGAMDVAAYISTACAIIADGAGTIKCWGTGYTSSNVFTLPVTVTTSFPAGVQASALSTGSSAQVFCVIDNDGSLWCWGTGAVGDGSSNGVASPVPVHATW